MAEAPPKAAVLTIFLQTHESVWYHGLCGPPHTLAQQVSWGGSPHAPEPTLVALPHACPGPTAIPAPNVQSPPVWGPASPAPRKETGPGVGATDTVRAHPGLPRERTYTQGGDR